MGANALVAGIVVDGGDAGLSVTLREGTIDTAPAISQTVTAAAGEVVAAIMPRPTWIRGGVRGVVTGAAAGTAGYRVAIA